MNTFVTKNESAILLYYSRTFVMVGRFIFPLKIWYFCYNTSYRVIFSNDQYKLNMGNPNKMFHYFSCNLLSPISPSLSSIHHLMIRLCISNHFLVANPFNNRQKQYLMPQHSETNNDNNVDRIIRLKAFIICSLKASSLNIFFPF